MIEALAVAITLSGCEVGEHPVFRHPQVTCSATNDGSEAVANIYLDWTIRDPARAVPWREAFEPETISIPGGIEPGETVPVSFRIPSIPERADMDAAVAEVSVVDTSASSLASGLSFGSCD